MISSIPPPTAPALDWRDRVIAGGLAAGLTAWLLPLANYGVDPHHDGIMLKPALDVLSGQAVFRDTFTHYGALTTYLQAMALWFQPTLLAVRVLTLATQVVTLLFLYLAWRVVLPRSLATVAGVMFMLFIPAYERDWLGDYWMLMPWSSAYALMFQSVGLLALLRMIRGDEPARWAALLGVTCGCALWCRTPVGLLMTAAVAVICVALARTGWKPAGRPWGAVMRALAGGLAVVLGLMFADLLISGAVAEWWYQLFVWPRQFMAHTVLVTWDQFVTTFVHPGAVPWLLALPLLRVALRRLQQVRPGLPAWVAPACYLALAGLLLWQRERFFPALALRQGGWTTLLPGLIIGQAIACLLPLWVGRERPKPADYYLVAAWTGLAVAALAQYYPLPDPWHILWSVAPAFGLFALLMWRWLGWPAPAVAGLLGIAFVPAAYAKAVSFQEAARQPWVKLEAPAVLRGMKVLPKTASIQTQVAATLAPVLQQRPDLPAVMIGNDALYLCFVNNRANPLPYFVNWPGLTDAAGQQQRWRYIHATRPLVFFQAAQWTAVGEFYQRERYVPLRYVEEVALEIAVPQEIADAMGVTTYGRPRDGAPPAPASK